MVSKEVVPYTYIAHTHTHMYIHILGYYLARKKKETLPSVTTDEGIMLSKISQTEKDKYHMTSFIVESKSKQTNE